jgi:hypothetical protein
MKMNAKDYWQAFVETGAPEFYTLYSQTKRLENSHVPDDQGSGVAPDGLQ